MGRGLLEKAEAGPNNLSFRDFEKLMKQEGWTFERQKGSHRLWVSPKGFRLPIQSRKGKAKGYQVQQFLAQYAQEHHSGTEKGERGESF
jgi:predicted RNA binding protein YcfA (HicA-like mRNA interferase family)